MSFERKDLIRMAGEGESVKVLDASIVFKAVSEETGQAYALFEYTAPPAYNGPPPHVHDGNEEAFFVLEGTLSVRQGNKVTDLGPGSFAQIARGTVHTFSNLRSTLTKFLVLVVPGGLEGYFKELPQIIEKHGYPPPFKVMMDLGLKYGFRRP